jgi:Zn-dependent peptidase ImmA (M78 family)/DNA-binding XRE family transcriptional regulator
MKIGTPGFNGKQLQDARISKTLTQTALASMLGVSRVRISQYEKGQHSPQPATLEQLADKLNKPISYFLEPSILHSTSPTFFRRLSAATKMERESAKKKLEWLNRIVVYIERFVDFPELNIPEIDSKGAEFLDFDDIENIANQCREHNRLSNTPILNIVEFLESNGLIISRWETETNALDGFSRFFQENNRFYIVMSDNKQCAVRSRFDGCHEYGHFVLHQNNNISIDNIKLIEEQANHFAGAFLLPADAFAKDIERTGTKLDSFWSLKHKWKVSIGTMIMRCRQLDMISEQQASRLWILYSKRGWRKKEPLDDRIPIEEPSFLKESLKLIIDNGLRTKAQLLEETGSSTFDFIELLRLSKYYFRNDTPKIIPMLKNQQKKDGDKRYSKNKRQIIPIK